jgi:hypothetical protein
LRQSKINIQAVVKVAQRKVSNDESPIAVKGFYECGKWPLCNVEEAKLGLLCKTALLK